MDGCSNNGACEYGTCVCTLPYSGPSCAQRKCEFVNAQLLNLTLESQEFEVFHSQTSPSVFLEIKSAEFYFNFLNISEISQNQTVVNTYTCDSLTVNALDNTQFYYCTFPNYAVMNLTIEQYLS
jgi:hypothetical protein